METPHIRAPEAYALGGPVPRGPGIAADLTPTDAMALSAFEAEEAEQERQRAWVPPPRARTREEQEAEFGRDLSGNGNDTRPPLPLASVQPHGRGVAIHIDRFQPLRHARAEIAACAEAVRKRFLLAWVYHLAESRYTQATEERIAAELCRVFSVTDAAEWLAWRTSDDYLRRRCPLTEAWFISRASCDVCGELVAVDGLEVVGDELQCVKCWERAR